MIKINQTLHYQNGQVTIPSGSVVAFNFNTFRQRIKQGEENIQTWIINMTLSLWKDEDSEANYSNPALIGQPDEFDTMVVKKEINASEYVATFKNDVDSAALVEGWVAEAIGEFESITANNVEIV